MSVAVAALPLWWSRSRSSGRRTSRSTVAFLRRIRCRGDENGRDRL